MPQIVTNSSTSLKSSVRLGKIDRGAIVCFALFALVGTLAIVRPLWVLACLGIAAGLGVCWLIVLGVRRSGLELWQILALIAVSGYLLLNYGFENLTIHLGGFPIIISYGLMYAALALAIFSHRGLIARGLQETPVKCVLILIVLAVFHLVMDVPRYGIWALRDSTMCLDGIFMFLGLAWAMKSKNVVFVTKWLLVVFILNLFYSFTQPWGEQLYAWSPVSGVFLKVPILGHFNGRGDILLAGALFCICVGSYVVKRPSWLMLVLAGLQFLGIAIAQTRRMYLAAVLVMLLLVVLGEAKKFAKLFVLVPFAIVVIYLVTTVGGIEITGRIGPVNLSFFKEHLRSLQTSEGTPGSAVEGRITSVDEALEHFYAHPVFGEGFGEPLLNEVDMNQDQGAVGRVPHNSSISYLARLGAIGFVVWIAFHLSLLNRFVHAFRQRHSADKRFYALALWFFLFYVLFMISSLVEGPFEFPSGAVPFFFLMGFALGLIRWHLSDKSTENRVVAQVSNAQKARLQVNFQE
jgi:O-antigen ligase